MLLRSLNKTTLQLKVFYSYPNLKCKLLCFWFSRCMNRKVQIVGWSEITWHGFLPRLLARIWKVAIQNVQKACANEQFIRQHMKNKIIIFNKWLSTGHLNTHLAKNLSQPMHPNEIAIDVKVKRCGCLIVLFLSIWHYHIFISNWFSQPYIFDHNIETLTV